MPATDPEKKLRYRKRRILVYGTLLALLWGFYVWVPWEFDFFSRRLPRLNPRVDPEASRLFSPGTRVLVITAHPDDSEFYIGGTLLKLADSRAQLTHILLTDGDKGYYPFEDSERNRKTRQAEQTTASKTWGASEIIFLGFPDGRLRANDEVVNQLGKAILEADPEYILSFDHDFPPRLSHGDHRKAGEAVEKALAQNVGNATWLLRFSTTAPNFAVDISDLWPKKKELLKIHASQFNGRRLEMVTNMVEESAIDDGVWLETPYAEGFRAQPLR